ncbi:MAG: GerMN domain-containing protein [Bacillota bacterium]
MVKRLALLLAVLSLASLFTGCAQDQEKAPQRPGQTVETVKLYFADEDNERLVTEDRQLAIKAGEDKYTAVLQALIKGPENDNYRVNISPNTRVYGTIKQGDKLIVDVNDDFARFGGSMAEILGVGAFVNTLTQFDEIDEVKILVEGEELIGPSGRPRGWMKTFPMQPGTSVEQTRPSATAPAKPGPSEVKRNVTLYFANQDATKVVPETRTISVPSNLSKAAYIKTIVNELIKGPRNSELRRTIPAEATVRSVVIKDSTAYVDFSQEMHSKHPGGAAGESMTINSIVNTLTELENITQVQITVEGKPLSIEHVVMDKPMRRNPSMIQQ